MTNIVSRSVGGHQSERHERPLLNNCQKISVAHVVPASVLIPAPDTLRSTSFHCTDDAIPCGAADIEPDAMALCPLPQGRARLFWAEVLNARTRSTETSSPLKPLQES